MAISDNMALCNDFDTDREGGSRREYPPYKNSRQVPSLKNLSPKVLHHMQRRHQALQHLETQFHEHRQGAAASGSGGRYRPGHAGGQNTVKNRSHSQS